jgi:hypothetical protein
MLCSILTEIDWKEGMSTARLSVNLQANLGQELHVSVWFGVTQHRIDQFAAVTGDDQWLHTNPSERPMNLLLAVRSTWLFAHLAAALPDPEQPPGLF